LLILFFSVTGLILILLGGIIFFIRKRKTNRAMQKE
jgi:LPXTG-motif cell wall-anchored protein